ncbi:hypothetical protein FQZ97_508210 [compost metagenome]
MFEDFSSEMVSQVALFLLIAIASGLLFDTSAVSLGRSGAQGVQCIAISKPRMAAARGREAQEVIPQITGHSVRLACYPMCRKERPSCRRGE